MKFNWKSFLNDILKISVAVLPSHIELDEDDSSESKLPSKDGGRVVKVSIADSKTTPVDSPSAK
jgi:hypothetical protein